MDMIERMIEGTAKVLAKVLFGKEAEYEFIIERETEADCLSALLTRMVKDGQYNEAENLLFEQLEQFRSIEAYNAGIRFYRQLYALTDAQLESGNFPRNEIVEGLQRMLTLCAWLVGDPDDNAL